MYRITNDQFETLAAAIGKDAPIIKEIRNLQYIPGYPLPKDPYPVRVLVEPGKTVPMESLDPKEQADVKRQMQLVSEVADLDFCEDDEWMV